VRYQLQPQITRQLDSQYQAILAMFLRFRKLAHSCTEVWS